MAKSKHVKKKHVVKVMLAHQGLNFVAHDGTWFIVCQCEYAEPAEAMTVNEDAASKWHASHIVDVMSKKGMLK